MKSRLRVKLRARLPHENHGHYCTSTYIVIVALVLVIIHDNKCISRNVMTGEGVVTMTAEEHTKSPKTDHCYCQLIQ